MSIWITSDLHFGHSNIIKHCQRPFASVIHMDESLINNWNSVVQDNDDVLVLGDFAFRNSRSISEYVRKLKGRISIILGNHDDSGEIRKAGFHKVFSDSLVEYRIPDGMDIDGHNKVVLCHYPMLGWNCAFHGRVHFFGHIHSGGYKPFVGQKNSYDVGVDNNNFTPVLLEEAIKKARQNTRILEYL